MGRKSKRKSKCNHTLKTSTGKFNGIKSDLKTDEIPTLSKTIPIVDRLGLPAYQTDEAEDEESELQLDFRPRPYFVSSLCYVCSKACDDVHFDCEQCGMVTYCSSQHRQQNLKHHKQLCTVLAEICVKNNGLDLARNLGPDEYRSFRVELLRIVEQALGRRMELCEREILLYPKLCRTCHSSDGLKTCSDCLMEFFCEEHRGNHEDHCAEWRVFRGVLAMQADSGFLAPKIPDFAIIGDEELPENFDGLMKTIFAFGNDYDRIDCASYAALSQAASPALTARYTLQLSAQGHKLTTNRKSLRVHVIGAELQFECANLAVWEKLFLHLLPGIKSLRLEFSGPELQVPDDIAKVLKRPRLCAGCRAKGREIHVVFHCGKLYHQIECDRPDLVCLFNPGLYRTTGFANQDTWPRTIEKFCDHGVPILITSYTEVELPRDLARVREYRELEVEQEPRRNPFASLRPERNFVSDDSAPLIYKNYFLSVARGIPGRCSA
ncbi:uncharacterized protein LOC131664241 isoform X2 [Phymastichus coffea]|uniref:uncharacterized protein LOC131664241 isoform X2 n=1 Tax=Phymastichus coffea TaxID=108790 RepID=UPI00273C13B3|nr:uncharacterized protein LOC131664241 isoform X2 [Phymastichus coffea]